MPDPDPASARASPTAEEFVAPRLGIIHLLIWITVAAVVLKMNAALSQFGPQGPSRVRVAAGVEFQVLMGVYDLLLATGLTGLGVLLLALRRARGRLQPGHWVLLVETIVSASAYLFRTASWLCQSNLLFHGVLNFVPYIILFGFRCGMFWFAGSRVLGGRGWRWSLRTFAVVNGLQGLLIAWASYVMLGWWGSSFDYFSLAFSPYWSLVLGLVLLVIAVLDARHRSRDWLHWLGVGLFEASVALSGAWWIWKTFLRPI